MSAQLEARDVGHALLNGNYLDRIFPAPEGDPARTKMTEANLAALWRNYAAAGCSRLIYANMVSVLEPDLIARAMGGAMRIPTDDRTVADIARDVIAVTGWAPRDDNPQLT